jgi:Cd2+/Zn2+-exporting ATPase
VTKEIGDKVFAGTVNEHGTMDIAVTKLASESTLARIIKMVEDAQERHSNTQRRLDRFEQYYAKVVIFSVALMVVIPPLLFSVDFDKNFYRSMVLLVVASPCALVISTPASILSAIANGARKGVLYKGGTYLEQMASLKAIAFDKTGTITYGKPSVTDMLPAEGVAERDLLSTLACVESPSEHPIAQAIIEKARAENLLICEPEKFQAMPGRGIVAALNGRQVLVGTESLMQQHGLTVPDDLLEKQRELEQGGKTTLLVYADQWLGLVGVADKVRPEAKETMRKLREAGIEHIAMLTGDNQRTAARIAEEVGVTEVHAELLPEQKVDVVNRLSEKYGLVAMVGDGVNDAPALAAAGIGIAMGAAGTDVALETADVVLMADDLGKIPYAINLSKRARRVVAQNLTFAMGVIVVLVTLALIPAVKLPLPLGVVGHEGSTIVVVLNGLRLLVWRGK